MKICKLSSKGKGKGGMQIIMVVAIGLISINIILSKKSIGSIWNQTNKNKVEAYECGYEPRDWGKEEIKINYIIVGILYLIFDIEVVIMLPYSVMSGSIWEYWIIMKVLWILTIGYINEIKKEVI